jgi:Zn-finger nucleic acid-binding protein
MNCPKCKVTLIMSERQGIEIDYCPECRGVWLDRGELDKIIERSVGTQGKPNYNHNNQMNDSDDYKRNENYNNKKKGWLGELFD